MNKAYIGDKPVVKIMLGDVLIWQKAAAIQFIFDRFIRAGSVEDGLAVAPTSAGIVMTDWIDVQPLTSYRLNFSLSNRRRIQSKSSAGVITYLHDNSADVSADGYVLTTNADASQIRIYFTTGYDGSSPIEASITAI